MIADLKPYPTMKPSDVEWLGDVPVHWDELPLKRIARIENSGNYGGEPESGECVLPVATTAQIDKEGYFSIDNMPLRSFSLKDADRYRCRPGDILVVKSSGSIFNVISGKAGIVDPKMPMFVFSNFLLRVIGHPLVVKPRYLFLLLSGHITSERVKRMVDDPLNASTVRTQGLWSGTVVCPLSNLPRARMEMRGSSESVT